MLGNRIKILREELHINQEELSKKLNLSSSTIAMYETNKRQPNNETLIKMSELFNCSIDYLLGKSNERYSTQIEDDLLKVGLSMKDYTPPTEEQKAKIREFAEFVLKDNKKERK